LDDLLSAKKAAALLGVSERTLERLRTDGEGPKYIKFGQTVRYQTSDLLAWIEGRKRASTSDSGAVQQGVRRRIVPDEPGKTAAE
jgi:excisionase family DNA binding protein